MICAFNDDEKKDASAGYINTFNNNSPFLITKLYKFSFFIFVWAYNDHRNSNYIHYKADFIKIIKIFNLNSIFIYYVAQ